YAANLWSTQPAGNPGTYTLNNGTDAAPDTDTNDFVVVNGGVVRNNAVAGVPTYFAGHSITLNTGAEIRFKGVTPTYIDFGSLSDPTGGLILNGGYIDTGDTANDVLHGRITLAADSTVTFQSQAGRSFDLEGLLVGAHKFTLTNAALTTNPMTIGGVIAPSDYTYATSPTPGTLTLATDGTVPATTNQFIFNNGVALDFNLGSIGTGTSDMIQVTGAATLAAGTDSVNVRQLAGFSVGTYTLINASAGLTDNVADSSWILPTGIAYACSITHDANSLYLNVGLAKITWTGSGESGPIGHWDTATSNWLSLAGSATTYADGGPVVFDDTGINTNIIIAAGGVQPYSVTFTNTNTPYTFSGGVIAGSCTVTLSGSGSVTFNNSNTYTGATLISAGTLQLGNANALQDSTVTLNALNGLTFAHGVGTFNLGGLAGTGSLALNDTSNGAINLQVGGDGASTSFAGNITAGSGSLTKVGSGMLTLSGVNSYTGATSISAGTLSATADSALGSTVALPGVSIANGAAFNAAGTFATSRVLTVAPSPGVSTIVVSPSQTLTVNAPMAGTGALTKNGGGTLQLGSGGRLSGGNLNMVNGTLDLGGNPAAQTVGVVSFSGGTLSDGGLSGSSYVFSGTSAATVSANLKGNNSPLTVNSGNAILLGSNTYGGGTMIASGGTLSATSGNAQALGTGLVTLNGGNLAVGSTPAPGLAANFYTPDPGNGTANQALFNTLSGVLAFVGSNTLAYTTNTASGTALGMNFPNAAGGNAFTSINYAGATDYTALFTGYVRIPTTGTYYFSTQSDDGSMLFLDNNNTPVVNNNFYQGMTTRVSTAQSLTAGYHPITIAYYQGGGGAGLLACADTSGTNYIPNSQLTTAIPTIAYSNSVTLTADSSITPYGDVTLAALSIGSNQLHVVAGNGTNLSFTGLITLGGSPNFNIDAGTGLSLLGAVSDGGVRTITESGGGTLTLSNPANSFTTGTNFQLSGGSLQVIGQQSPLGGPATGPIGAVPVTLSGGALVITATSATPITFDVNQGNTVTLPGGGSIIAGYPGAVDNTMGVSGGTVTLVGSNGGLVIPSGQKLNLETLNGYTLNIDPNLQLTNSGTISGGPGSVSVHASSLAVSAGTLSAATNGTLTLLDPMSTGYYAPAATGTVVLAGAYSGALANLAPLSGGTLVINNNVTAGTLNVAGGAYFANNNSSFGLTTTTLSLNGGTLGATTALTGSNAVANPLTWGATPTLNFSGASNLELSASLSLTSGGTAYNLNDPATHGTLSGVISGLGGLNITGYPTLKGSNTYSGGTTLNNATNVTINNNRAFGTGTITFNNGGFQATTPLTGGNAVANPWTIAAGSAAYFNGTNAYQLSGSASLATGNESIHVANPALTVTLSSVISGTGATLIRATDAAGQFNGTVVISNSGNTFGGGFTLQSLGGNIDVQGASTVGGPGSVTSGPLGTGTITIGSANNGWINLENTAPVAATLANAMNIYDGCTYTSLAGLTFSGPVTLTGPGQGATNNGIIDFWLGTNSNVAFAGAISGGTKGINLRSDAGSGGLTLSGANTYSGPTSISFGTLIAGGSAPSSGNGVFGNSTGAITIGDANSLTNPAALVTNGAYTIARPITVNVNAGPTTLGTTITSGTATFSGAISLNNVVTLSAPSGGTALFTGVISDGGALGGIVAGYPGSGNIILSLTGANANSYSGGTTVAGGQLTLDYSLLTPSGGSVGNIVNPNSSLTLSAGTLNFNGNSSAAVNQAFGSTTVANFGSSLVVSPTNGQSVQVNLGSITRNGG
ncbi:MAG: autotransporter-associated beta strand repeat-containing protein, partial [Thermoguttaceae bacterium]